MQAIARCSHLSFVHLFLSLSLFLFLFCYGHCFRIVLFFILFLFGLDICSWFSEVIKMDALDIGSES